MEAFCLAADYEMTKLPSETKVQFLNRWKEQRGKEAALALVRHKLKQDKLSEMVADLEAIDM